MSTSLTIGSTNRDFSGTRTVRKGGNERTVRVRRGGRSTAKRAAIRASWGW